MNDNSVYNNTFAISIVLPAYNEADNLAKQIYEIATFFQQKRLEHEIIVINDGSTDHTAQLLHDLSDPYPQLRVIHHPHNLGYGPALRSGFQAACLPWIFLIDADCQFRVADLYTFFDYVGYDLIIGYREHRQDHFIRKLNAWLYHRLVALVFDFRVQDIDCAFKLMRRDLVQAYTLQSKSSFISTELLLKAHQRGSAIIELPVSHFARPCGKATGAHPKVIARALRELVCFKLSMLRRNSCSDRPYSRKTFSDRSSNLPGIQSYKDRNGKNQESLPSNDNS